jgi:hypothetical protein
MNASYEDDPLILPHLRHIIPMDTIIHLELLVYHPHQE